MNEISETFDYSIVDDQTADFLKAKEQEMRTIVLNGAVQLGDKLIEAQEKLAKYKNGTFEKWFTSLGLKKTTAYNYINQAQFVHQMNESEQIDMFQELPMTLRTEISKPSAEPEAVELVLSGDIKTTKEYRELEKQLKKKDEQIDNLSEVINDMSVQQPRVIEKEVVVEKIPDDYENLKQSYSELEERSSQLESSYRYLLAERKEVDEKSSKYEQLSKAINQAEGKLNETQQLISNYKNLSDVLEKSNEFLSEASILIYQDLSEVISRDGLAKRELDFLTERLEKFLSDLKSISKNNILEGEIINE
jgi:DNA repair exonuclease SbcCD ATPase subunit